MSNRYITIFFPSYNTRADVPILDSVAVINLLSGSKQ